MYTLCFQCSVPLTSCVVVHTTVCSFPLTVWLLRHQLRYFVDHHRESISLYVYMLCRLGIPSHSSHAICSVWHHWTNTKIGLGYCVSQQQPAVVQSKKMVADRDEILLQLCPTALIILPNLLGLQIVFFCLTLHPSAHQQTGTLQSGNWPREMRRVVEDMVIDRMWNSRGRNDFRPAGLLSSSSPPMRKKLTNEEWVIGMMCFRGYQIRWKCKGKAEAITAWDIFGFERVPLACWMASIQTSSSYIFTN